MNCSISVTNENGAGICVTGLFLMSTVVVHYKLPCDESLGATCLPRNVYDGVRGENTWSASMAIQIVMDHTGDTRHWFNPDDTEALSKAEKRFKSLTTVGYTAAVRDAAGKATVTRSFDPTAEETVFYPRLVGG